jgi:pimeloyl-ACP methyl ester carboxylesterase
MTDIVTREDFLSFDGVRIGWHELAPRSGPARPILLLHGLFSSGDMNWRRYGAAAEIAGAGFRVIMPDFRAHGVSAAPHDAAAYPVDVLSMDVEALVRHLGLHDFDLAGYSLGARTAVRLVVRGLQPRRLIVSGMGLEGLIGGADRAAWFLNVIAKAGSFTPGTPEHAAAAFMKANHIDGAAVAHVLRSQVSTPIETVKAIAIRTLVLCGNHDFDNGSAADLALTLANAALVEIPGNHMSAVTKPDFGAAIAAWLQHA